MSDELYWVFAYGSLIWDPGFPYVEKQRAVVHGYHRRFCLYSHRYRGTPEAPGLVLGLDKGGSCHGVAYAVPSREAEAVRAYLWVREMFSNAYRPRLLQARLADDRRVMAQTFVIVPDHPQYAGRLGPDFAARLIASSHGERGSNLAYLENTLLHLLELGIQDRSMRRLLAEVRQVQQREGEKIDRPFVPSIPKNGF